MTMTITANDKGVSISGFLDLGSGKILRGSGSVSLWTDDVPGTLPASSTPAPGAPASGGDFGGFAGLSPSPDQSPAQNEFGSEDLAKAEAASRQAKGQAVKIVHRDSDGMWEVGPRIWMGQPTGRVVFEGGPTNLQPVDNRPPDVENTADYAVRQQRGQQRPE